jgi:MoaA/NifB/PqqE/SkfB family radical SAM enzyme
MRASGLPPSLLDRVTPYLAPALLQRWIGRFAPPAIDVRIQRILSSIDTSAEAGDGLGAVAVSLEASKAGLYTCFLEFFDSVAVAQALTIKVMNLCLAKHQFRARSTVLAAQPFGLLLDPANGCNLACPGCVHSRSAKKAGAFDWQVGMLSESRGASILERFGPYAIQVLFFNYGEPLLNPATPNLIRRAKNYLAQTMVSTNLAMPRFDPDAYVRSGLDYMTISIDGATQGVYEKYRRTGSIDLVYQNVQKLVEAKVRNASRTPVLCWQYLAFEHNAHEIVVAAETARSLGLDEFRIASPFDVGWDDPTIRPAEIEPQLICMNEQSEEDLFANWNPFPGEIDSVTIQREFEVNWDQRLQQLRDGGQASGSTGHTCHWLYKNIVLDSNGRVFPCCGAPTPGKNLTFSKFTPSGGEDHFNSEMHREARGFFLDGSTTDSRLPCVGCTWSQTKTDIDTPQVEHYLKAAGGLFNAGSIRMITSW